MAIVVFCTTFLSATSIDILYESNTDIAGFQFDVEGVTVLGASGGAAADAGFMVTVNPTRVIGFSLSGAIISSGSGILTQLEIK